MVTPEGFPLAYEVLPGNTTDKTTLQDFLAKIERQYGKAERIWVMDRGIPTEATLKQMRASDPPVSYLVGTPKGKLTALEADLAARDWQQARPRVRVKLLPQEGETYVLVQSQDRIAKERAMRRRRLRAYLDRLAEIKARKRPLGPMPCTRLSGQRAGMLAASFTLRPGGRATPRSGRNPTRRPELEARPPSPAHRLATRRPLPPGPSLTETDPAKLWEYHLQLTTSSKPSGLKGNLTLRPIHHQREHRIEAHVFVSFLASASK